MNKINKDKEQKKQICENIFKKADEELVIEDLITVEDIISKINTEPIIILTYLKLFKKFKKKEEYMQQIINYDFFLSKEQFQQINEKKLSSSALLFTELYDNIAKCSGSIELNNKDFLFLMLISKSEVLDKKFLKGFTDYESNPELSIFILVQNVKQSIIKRIKKVKSFNIDKSNKLIKYYQANIQYAKIVQKVSDYDNNNLKDSKDQPNLEERKIYEMQKKYIENPKENIKNFEEIIELRAKFDDKDFLIYFLNLANFLDRIKQSFYIRFQNFEKLKENEFNLLKDFCLFIRKYDFQNEVSEFYLNKWMDTFYQTEEYIKEASYKKSTNNIKHELKDNNLILTIYDPYYKVKKIGEIPNINKYSINNLLTHLVYKYDKRVDNYSINIDITEYKEKKIIINEYELEKCLKFDALEEIYIYKIRSILENHLIKIFTSDVMKLALEKICEEISAKNYYDFLNEEELKLLFKRARIFQFKSNILGLTNPSFLTYYIFYRGKIDSYAEEASKLLNICIYQITQSHEMLGHLNIRIQNYFSINEISSPISKYYDEFENEVKEPESGIYIEEILYGEILHALNINQILFLLDEENYNNIKLEEFQNNFKQSKNKEYKASKSLLTFLNDLKININDLIKIKGNLLVNTDLQKLLPLYKQDLPFSLYNNHHEDLHPYENSILSNLKNISKELEKYIEKTKEEER